MFIANNKELYEQRIILVLFFSFILCFIPVLHVQSQIFCSIQQITDEPSGSSAFPTINSDGNRIAFVSTANINGGNPDGMGVELYLFDTVNREFLQITDDPTGESSISSINGDGTRIAFRSDQNINNGNPELNDEIFLFDSSVNTIKNVTNSMADNFNPSLSANGSIIAFTSRADLTGKNIDGNGELFTYNVNNNTFRQITNTTTGVSANPAVNADGTKISFESSANILGPNPEEIFQVFLFDTNTNIFTRITNDSSGDSVRSSINGDGTKITFFSVANLNGQNPDGNGEFYLFDSGGSVLTQITFTTTGVNSESEINGNGDRIAFTSSANIDGQNPNLTNSIYIFEVNTNIIRKVIDLPVGFFNLLIAFSSDGESIAFATDANVNGRNPENNTEIYLAWCPIFGNTTIPTLSEWGFITMAIILGIIGLFAIRCGSKYGIHIR